MLTRRLVAGACALCLAVPAAATAKPVYIAHAHHAVVVATGDTKGDLPGAVPAVAPGDTKNDLPSTPASHNTAVAPQPTASSHDATNGWRLAAVIEAGVVAAFAIGAAVFMSGRRHRAPRMGV